jgi:hypothetical protein
VVVLDQGEREQFFELTAAEPPNGLDDGEAAAIALTAGSRISCILVLDDRKICTQRPNVAVRFSVDLFRDARVTAGITKTRLEEAVFGALMHTQAKDWVSV